MKRIVMVVVALATALAVALPALADDGKGKERDGFGAVCRPFEVLGSVKALDKRSVVVSVQRAAPKRLRATEVTIATGSRTRVSGDVAVGGMVLALGWVCQVDEADAPVFYAMKLRAKKEERSGKTLKFELVGSVESFGGGTVEVLVDRTSIDGMAGKVVKIALAPDAKVEGEIAPDAIVLVVGAVRWVDGAPVLSGLFVKVKESGGTGSASDDGKEDGSDDDKKE